MAKLNQVIALVAGKKKKAAESITQCYCQIQKPGLMDGIERVYTPKDEEGERLPKESKGVQVKTAALLEEVSKNLAEMFDMVATQDYANCKANAVIQNGKFSLPNVPVTHLLFLEKQLTDLHTFVSKLPVLDAGKNWEFDDTSDCYKTKPEETMRTKKVPKHYTKAEATDKHPAQVEMFHEDVQVGTWRKIDFSGAIPAKEKNAMIERVRALQEAVVTAREEANSTEVVFQSYGKKLLDYVFGEQ